MNAESTLKDRLSSLVNSRYVNPFEKVASTDLQLDAVASSMLDEIDAEEPIPASIRKVASVTDYSLRELIENEHFRRGFADAFTAKEDELIHTLDKVASLKK